MALAAVRAAVRAALLLGWLRSAWCTADTGNVAAGTAKTISTDTKLGPASQVQQLHMSYMLAQAY